jgi:oligogalacturonide lyase
MSVGREYRDVPFRYADPFSGREITRLTDYKGHSSLLYFTDNCWLPGHRSFVFVSDREGRSNLFRYDLDEGRIVQLTDLPGNDVPGGCTSADRLQHYFWYEGAVFVLDLKTLEVRELWRPPAGFVPQSTLISHTADHRYVVSVVREDVFAGERPQIEFLYSRGMDLFRAKPLCRVMRIDIGSGAADVVHEDRCYLSHANASPTRPELITFCHEGPWAQVDHRLWGLNLATGECWQIRPRGEGESIRFGHEYWLADGVRIGYHGLPKDPHPVTGARREFFGIIRYDNTGLDEHWYDGEATHFFTQDGRLMLSDGTPAFAHRANPYLAVHLRRAQGADFEPPRVLAMHRSTLNGQHAHPHPQTTPDGRHALWNSDLTGYANIFMASLADPDTLPAMPVL